MLDYEVQMLIMGVSLIVTILAVTKSRPFTNEGPSNELSWFLVGTVGSISLESLLPLVPHSLQQARIQVNLEFIKKPLIFSEHL